MQKERRLIYTKNENNTKLQLPLWSFGHYE